LVAIAFQNSKFCFFTPPYYTYLCSVCIRDKASFTGHVIHLTEFLQQSSFHITFIIFIESKKQQQNITQENRAT